MNHEKQILQNRDLSKYNVIFITNGSPTNPLSLEALSKLKEWTNNGKTLIATGNAYRLTNKAKITDFKLLLSEKNDEKSKGSANIEYQPYLSGCVSKNNIKRIPIALLPLLVKAVKEMLFGLLMI